MIEICSQGSRCPDCPLPKSVVSLAMDEQWYSQGIDVSPASLQKMYEHMYSVEVGDLNTDLYVRYVKLVAGIAQLRVVSGLCSQTPINIRKEI